jgi:hypothetical protein
VHDTFGADDGDWAVYKKMDRDAADSEGEEEEAELERVEDRLRTGETLPPPVSPYRWLRIQGGKVRGRVRIQVHCI